MNKLSIDWILIGVCNLYGEKLLMVIFYLKELFYYKYFEF